MWCKGRLAWIGAGATAAMFALTGAASAQLPLTLSGPFLDNSIGPQATSAPCIIAGTSCHQPAGFGFNNFVQAGNIPVFNMYSTSVPGGNNGTNVPDGVQGVPYTVGQILGFFPNGQILVAIDVNSAGAHDETLTGFNVYIGGTAPANIAYSYQGPDVCIGCNINNGNGFGDWTLGVINLAGLDPSTPILFQAQWSGATDGAESFFLVPGPIVGGGLPGLVLACSGLIGLARRRRRQVA